MVVGLYDMIITSSHVCFEHWALSLTPYTLCLTPFASPLALSDVCIASYTQGLQKSHFTPNALSLAPYNFSLIPLPCDLYLLPSALNLVIYDSYHIYHMPWLLYRVFLNDRVFVPK